MLTRIGRLNQPVQNNTSQLLAPPEELLRQQNDIIQQLMRTKTKINVWQLIASSHDVDLPLEGNKHNKALHLTVACMGLNVPMTLVDNVSAINVCPTCNARYFGFKDADFSPSHQGIRAYDNHVIDIRTHSTYY